MYYLSPKFKRYLKNGGYIMEVENIEKWVADQFSSCDHIEQETSEYAKGRISFNTYEIYYELECDSGQWTETSIELKINSGVDDETREFIENNEWDITVASVTKWKPDCFI